jgi:hypothetical protein
MPDPRTALPPAAAVRLVRICGLLGSDQAGEAASAAAAATKLIRSAGLTWQELLEPIVVAPPPPRPPSPDWRAAVGECLQQSCLFTKWECDFLSNLVRFRRLSPKQADILARLYSQVCAAAGDAP